MTDVTLAELSAMFCIFGMTSCIMDVGHNTWDTSPSWHASIAVTFLPPNSNSFAWNVRKSLLMFPYQIKCKVWVHYTPVRNYLYTLYNCACRLKVTSMNKSSTKWCITTNRKWFFTVIFMYTCVIPFIPVTYHQINTSSKRFFLNL